MISKKTVLDAVYICPELRVDQFYNGVLFTSEMAEFTGSRAKIINVFLMTFENRKKEIGYRLDCDEGTHIWTGDMLEEYDPMLFFENSLFVEIMNLKQEIFVCGPDGKTQARLDALEDCQKEFNWIFKGEKT